MRMVSRCFNWFPNCLVLGEPNIYQNLGDFTICEECSNNNVLNGGVNWGKMVPLLVAPSSRGVQ